MSSKEEVDYDADGGEDDEVGEEREHSNSLGG